MGDSSPNISILVPEAIKARQVVERISTWKTRNGVSAEALSG